MSPTSDRDWDAATYDRVSDIQLGWALEQLERLNLRGDEVVLDAGCGSGRVTALLVDRVPRGKVYAVDVAPSMAAHARTALGDRANVLCQDLLSLDLPEPVDMVFSNATFHWVLDHDALFAGLARATKAGGGLLAQCGGQGNIDEFRQIADGVAAEEPFEYYFRDWQKPWNYATAELTAQRLRQAGYGDVQTWVEPRSVTPEDGRAFISTVCLVRHLEPLPQTLRDPFLDRVLARCGEPLVLDYVRLNMTAVRA